jgi:hypothetical protein
MPKARSEPGSQSTRSVAVHEAGHAVIGVVLDRWLIEAKLYSQRGHTVGITSFGRHPSLDPRRHKSLTRFRSLIEREVVIAWAGFCAEVHGGVRKRLDGSENADADMIMALLERLTQRRSEQIEIGAALKVECGELVKFHWRRINSVSSILLAEKRVSGKTVRGICS